MPHDVLQEVVRRQMEDDGEWAQLQHWYETQGRSQQRQQRLQHALDARQEQAQQLQEAQQLFEQRAERARAQQDLENEVLAQPAQRPARVALNEAEQRAADLLRATERQRLREQKEARAQATARRRAEADAAAVAAAEAEMSERGRRFEAQRQATIDHNRSVLEELGLLNQGLGLEDPDEDEDEEEDWSGGAPAPLADDDDDPFGLDDILRNGRS